MADHLSFTLGQAGYRIHKIVPYGPVHETLQYLIRYALHHILPLTHLVEVHEGSSERAQRMLAQSEA